MTRVERTRRWRLRWLADIAILALACVYIVPTALGARLNHNEQMYVAAARLWWDFQLYADYAFLQAPLLPIVNGLLFALAGQDQLLSIARLHVAFWAIVAVMAVYGIGRQICGGDRIVASGAALAVASHALFLQNAAESSNYMMPLALAVLSLLALLRSLAAPTLIGTAHGVASGLTAGLAVACKSYYAVPAIALFAMAWVLGGRRQRGPWSIGFGVGVLPLVYYGLRDPERFYFGNLGYHVANVDYRRLTETDMPMTLAEKLGFVGELWHDPASIALTTYALVGLVFLARPRPPSSRGRALSAMAWLLFALSCCAVLIPTPTFVHYFGMPFVFLLILAMTAAALREGFWNHTFFGICLVAVACAPATYELAAAFPTESESRRLEEESAKLRSLIGCTQATYVATLSPIIPLEAGCAIYPELASGPFAFRVADQYPLEQQQRLRIVGPTGLEAFLDARRPSAIFVGFESRLDPYFEDYARTHGYVEAATRLRRRGRVWRSPALEAAVGK